MLHLLLVWCNLYFFPGAWHILSLGVKFKTHICFPTGSPYPTPASCAVMEAAVSQAVSQLKISVWFYIFPFYVLWLYYSVITCGFILLVIWESPWAKGYMAFISLRNPFLKFLFSIWLPLFYTWLDIFIFLSCITSFNFCFQILHFLHVCI